ncbi:phosphoserine phosphatase SerB [Noviherbaspirillum soli]|uniref:phosphoserine phosphatase SerB n=1 Tax=Noviherbaspirillum soli TaxID=1064518 RepID=UPI00188C4579|nr:phosphoserine phosphatase SerB [Noviherbaspirillum soli]
MNLIFQGSTDRATIDRLAAPSRPARIEQIHAHAWRCVDVADNPAVRSQIEEASLQSRVDATFIEAGRQLSDFGLLAMDMDSTVITIECIDEIADMQGLKPQVAAITEAAMRGEIEFAESLTRRVALLEGLDANALQKVYDERLKFSPGAEALISAAHAAGVKTLLVSGGFTFFTDRVRQRLNLDYSHANVLEVADGRLTGKVVGGIVDAEEKKRTVERVCAELGIPARQAIVMGDGANDLKMMSVAGLSVAYRAKPVVRAQADVALNFSGLDGILALLAQ